MVKSYCPSSISRFVTLFFGILGIALCSLVVEEGVRHVSISLACIFAALGIVLAIVSTFNLTLRVEMDAQLITRSWLFGRTVVPIGEIHRLSWGGARGVLVLTIYYGAKRFVQFSSNSLEKEELHAIQRDVLIARGLEGETIRPRYSESVVDIDEMLKMKR